MGSVMQPLAAQETDSNALQQNRRGVGAFVGRWAVGSMQQHMAGSRPWAQLGLPGLYTVRAIRVVRVVRV